MALVNATLRKEFSEVVNVFVILDKLLLANCISVVLFDKLNLVIVS